MAARVLDRWICCWQVLAGCTMMDIIDILRRNIKFRWILKHIVRGNQRVNEYPYFFTEYQDRIFVLGRKFTGERRKASDPTFRGKILFSGRYALESRSDTLHLSDSETREFQPEFATFLPLAHQLYIW